MNVLAIDTSNYALGVSIINDKKVIGEYITNMKKNHSIRVMPAIQRLLEDCDLSPADIDKIVVAHGPGSYTGVRIGVTIAKTLAWTLKVPLVGVSSLEVLAADHLFFPGIICPLFDARRSQVYTGLYQFENGRLTSVLEDQLLLLPDLLNELKIRNESVLFAGNDVELHRERIIDVLGEKANFAPFTHQNPRPSVLARIGADQKGVTGDALHAFVPQYLRLAEAEAKWREARKNDE
ncbi:MAG TPA: tRNA (adenosine(37)-N6)-threonylcarbamoyltransferase complex dimerization subunit type 1 TsaB [Bacillus sp. (in: firmicutes)]|uniref:tRNA (adenosine(37)-N6)-threonylcarbamoyltransferase complex dimerization subunit type 1 TsaB n=1 Tax=Bacillus litorisediminis TaxID=2922713 RepID=UPI001FADB550|nr:tRNA (adenosine(37)-N6)-threonylcarbamoyltransferase complex dimerization subunit type 1 TsaB [Bacillus litorisediminis]HWO78553.1 tRNA (adenosine(37)-N6)-threonylcarbamoyltransferase complex dimerization subunit type 1 TsaB [Bacillus sp. (in: firmicutes)]